DLGAPWTGPGRSDGQERPAVLVACHLEPERGPAGQPAEVLMEGELRDLVLDRVRDADVKLMPHTKCLVQPPVRWPAVPSRVTSRVGQENTGARGREPLEGGDGRREQLLHRRGDIQPRVAADSAGLPGQR